MIFNYFSFYFLCMYLLSLSFQTPFILFDFIVLVIMNNTLIVLHMPAKKGVNKFEMNRISAKRCIKSFAIKQNTFIFQISFRLNANLCFNFEDRVRFTNVYLQMLTLVILQMIIKQLDASLSVLQQDEDVKYFGGSFKLTLDKKYFTFKKESVKIIIILKDRTLKGKCWVFKRNMSTN